MASSAAEFERGRVYRRCGCRGADRRPIGARCPRLAADELHGSWAYAVDMPTNGEGRSTRRRSGYGSREDAVYALQCVLNAEATGVFEDRKLTVGAFLLEWVALKERTLKPSTAASYAKCVRQELLPVFGRMRLKDLRSRHVAAWQTDLRDQGRGAPTVYRLGATLRSALNHAVRKERLIGYNAAEGAIGSRPAAAERLCWTALQAAAFLRHNELYYRDQVADVFEVMLGTGMRRGEVLGLHWEDVHFRERKIFVRWTLATIDNNELHLCAPKPRRAGTGSASIHGFWPRCSARPTTSNLCCLREPRCVDSSSQVSTEPRCARSTSWTSCGTARPRPGCRRSRSTICGTRWRPS